MDLASLSDEVRAALARVRLLALDVDGTLTDGRVTYAGQQEVQAFCVKDGQGLAWLAQAGVQQAWITGRGCAATERRALDLKVQELHMQAGPKASVLAGVQERLQVTANETIAMGDDLPDLLMAQNAALLVAPCDALAEVRAQAAIVTEARAGHGSVRELAEMILRAKGLWSDVLGRYNIAVQ